ncbi:MAG: lamin tail domain-containing protein, partial [Verrucomicrobiales bacterium]
ADGFPAVLASNDSTVGYWRFDEPDASAGNTVSTATDSSGNGLEATPRGSGGGSYSTDVPGAQIFDPLANASRSNSFSMDVSGSNRRLGTDSSPLFDTSFTLEMFIKIDGEPGGYNTFLRRNQSGTSRWQIDFDHADKGAFGRMRSRWDTPDGDNSNFVVGPTGGGSVPEEDRIWIDTDSGNGLVASYNDPSDWSDDGDGVNDIPGWHHLAIALDQDTGEVRFYFDYELKQSRMLADSDGSGYVHPAAGLEFGKFSSAYGLLVDEIRYTARRLEPDQFLQVVSAPAEIWSTYTIDLGDGDEAQRSALLNYINANNQTGFTPVLQVRDESYSATGRTFTLDSFRVDVLVGGAVNQLIDPGASWRHTTGAVEPSGGVFEPAFVGESPGAELVDWIELHNDGASAVDLGGWSISDNPGQPAKWSFPAGTQIDAGGFLLLLADDEDGSGLSTEFLHTNFKLSRGGEFLGLFDAGGVVRSQFSPGFPRQLDFYSYGRNPAGPGFGYLEAPTPGSANSGPFFAGEVAKPDFDSPGGFHPAALSLSMSSATPGASIRYTTDGSEPTETNGNDYVGTLSLPPIGSRTAHTIRARAFATGLVPSRTKSASYLIAQSANLRQAPALMITADEGRSILKPHGVLAIEGGQYVDQRWEPLGCDDYNMAMQRGRPVERPAFLEYYFADTTEGFREDAGIRIAASNYSRPRMIFDSVDASPWLNNSREKPSFNLFFRDEYEDDSVTLPMFGPDYPVDTFEQFRPRAGKNDITNPFIKDEIMRRLYLDMGQVGSHGVFNSLYVNGEWKGYYNTCERLREPFFQSHYPGSEQWDIRQAGNPDGGLAEGDNDAWNELNTRLQAADVNSQTAWESALELVDPIAMADYFLLNIYGATWDWPGNNWVSARERSDDGRYRYYVWDAEGAFGHPRRNGNNNSNKPVDHNTIQDDLLSQGNSTSLMFQRLERWPEFKLILADRIHRHFFNAGTLDDSAPASSRIKEVIDAAVAEFAPLNSERNGNSVDTEFWRYWSASGASRRSYLFGPNATHFRSAGYWPLTAPPAYNQYGGDVPAGFQLVVSHSAPVGSQIYFTLDGSDPREFGGAIGGSAQLYSSPLPLTNASTLARSRVRNSNGEWSALTEATFKLAATAPAPDDLVISEFLYNPIAPNAAELAAGFTDKDDFEFIQIRNISSGAIDLGDVDFTAGISFDFASGTLQAIDPGADVILVSDLAAFRLRYGSAYDPLIAGEYSGQLSNEGEQIRLSGPGSTTLREFTYNDSAPWPTCADGHGVSLVLRSPETSPDHSQAENWFASGQFGGLPGGLPRSVTFADWQKYFFTAAEQADPLISDPAADPDGDRLQNLVEYYLGGIPTKSDADQRSPQVSLVADAGEHWLTLSFSTPQSLSDTQATAEVSGEVQDWSSAPTDILELLPATANGDGTVTRSFRVAAPTSARDRQFVRLRVTLE